MVLGAFYLALLLALHAAADSSHAYDSLIKPVVRGSVYWQVTNDECSSVHAYNLSTGELTWDRSPVDHDQAWSSQVTEKRAFYTLKSGGPQVTAVTLETGNVRWSWPDRVGSPLWKHWDTDLPQKAALDTPLPAITAQQLLLRVKGAGTKLLALDLYNGSRVWELDVADNMTVAAQVAGLTPPAHITITSWLHDGCDTAYISLLAQHAASGAPNLFSIDQPHASHGFAGHLQPGMTQHDIMSSISGAAAQLRQQPQQQQEQQREEQQQRARLQHSQPSAAAAASSVGDADVVQLGWVVCVDLRGGGVRWVAGPLQQGPLSLTLTEPVLLAASSPEPGETGWLYGLHKVTGAALYSLPCAGSHCLVQVTDTHVGLLTASLMQQPPSLDGLAAFEFATGQLLWRGVQDSKLQLYVSGDCSGLTDPTMHTYLACTCVAAEAIAAGFTPADPEAASAVTAAAPSDHGISVSTLSSTTGIGLAGTADGAGGDDGTAQQEGEEGGDDSQTTHRHHHHHHHHHTGSGHDHGHKPRPRPDPKPGPGLCAFAISTSTGKLGFEVLLASTDAVPVGAATYGLKPFAMADTIVFPGRKAVYAMPRLSAAEGPTQHAQHEQHASVGSSVAAPQGGQDVGQATATSRRLNQVSGTTLFSHDSSRSSGSGSGSSSSGNAVRPVFSFRLPTGVVLQPWDWLDLKSGTLLLRASPHFAEQADHKLRTGQVSIGSGDTASSDSRSSSSSNVAVGGASMLLPRSVENAGTGVSDGGVDQAARSRQLLMFGWGKKRRPSMDEDPPQTWLFAINPLNGSAKWSLALDVWVPPLSPHALPHEWGRGGVLLVDGCRPPAGDDGTDDEGNKGTTCCLHAVALASGQLLWQNCFDMDRACASGFARSTATLIVYLLLAAQVLVLVLGCVLGVLWHRRMRRRAAASIMQDPDSEDEALIVQVLPAGYNITTSGRVRS